MNTPTLSKSIGVGALFQYFGTGVQLISGVVFYILLTRMFSTTEVGAVALFVAIVGIFNIIFQFGLGSSIQHFASYHIGLNDMESARRYVKTVVVFGLILSLTGFFVIYATSPVLTFLFLHSIEYVPMVRLLGVVVFGTVLFTIINSALIGLQKFKISGVVTIIIWASYYSVAIVLAYFNRSLKQIIIGWIIGILVGVIIESFILIRLTSDKVEFQFRKDGASIFKYSLPIVFSSMIGFGATYADRFIVAGLMNLSQLGIYNLSLIIANSLSFLSIPFNNILLPKFSEWNAKGQSKLIKDRFRLSSLLLASFFVPSTLGLSAISGVLIRLLSGSSYLSSEIPLDIIAFGNGVFITQNIAFQALASIRKTKIFAVTGLLGLTTNIALSYTLIPLFGILGASFGFISIHCSTFFVLYVYCVKYNIWSFDMLGIMKIWISSLLMFIIVNAVVIVTDYSLILLPVYILTGVVIAVMTTRLLGIFSKNDKTKILSFFTENSKPNKIIQFVIGN